MCRQPLHALGRTGTVIGGFGTGLGDRRLNTKMHLTAGLDYQGLKAYQK